MKAKTAVESGWENAISQAPRIAFFAEVDHSASPPPVEISRTEPKVDEFGNPIM
jgi:hypothetical protein